MLQVDWGQIRCVAPRAIFVLVVNKKEPLFTSCDATSDSLERNMFSDVSDLLCGFVEGQHIWRCLATAVLGLTLPIAIPL